VLLYQHNRDDTPQNLHEFRSFYKPAI